ncbi:alanyl (membrane) aminopeptidase-like b isoform X2 [Halichoeres trimaculatus]|uniref:alanyl (membrane) aminopeptidase-like b isoform X2 n=1 Tax=Halichoeres trimaculatus TaxID=147232 RepID=UPI003D9F1C5F
MVKSSTISKAIAIAFVTLTICAIGGIITMVIFYKTQIATMNPTPRPTIAVTTPAPPPVMRLPKNLVPERYELFLQPHLYTQIIQEVNVTSPNQTMLFTGNSTVHFRCVQKTDTIYLHSVDLTLSGQMVIDKDRNRRIGVSSMRNFENGSNFLEINLVDNMEEGGNYSLFLAFKGEISENLQGLYVSHYVEGHPVDEDDTSPNRFLVATNLQPADARRVFPCFDEPEMKAEFDVTIIHRRDTTALGNSGRSESNIIDEEWKYTRFYRTPKMSTYLFAFTVSRFESVLSPHGRVEIRTFARPEAIKAGHAQYAASVTGKILSYYEQHFGINYQQKKLDQIALPDLAPAAMENWGLITYEQGSLLFEEGVSSLLLKEWIVTIIAHELAHQWFGNLVTMKWWNEVWLNEGFATYMANFAMNHVEPSFKMKEAYILGDLHTAFEEDALATSHPLSLPQDEVQDIDEMAMVFDGITYSKGASVLRMLADVVDQPVFDKGIRTYLDEFRLKNTDRNDLWESIQRAVDDDSGHTDVAKVMDLWTTQIGYPVITINTTSGEIYQKHFLFNATSESSLWWHIPIRVMSDKSEPDLLWLDTPDTVKKDEFISKKGEWILANVNCTGYYRVNYNPENWERLQYQLLTNPERIPLMNRGQLIDDAFNLARAKLVDVTLALNSTRFLRNETEYLPWESAVRNMKYIVRMFDRSEVYGPMQEYFREQVKVLYKYFKNETDHSTVPKEHSLQHSQIIAVQVACSNGLPECTAMATELFSKWMNSNDSTNSFPPH